MPGYKKNCCWLPVSQVLLSDSEGHVLEGLTTNFFVVAYEDSGGTGGDGPLLPQQATLYCSSPTDPALYGTVQARVVEAAQALGLRVAGAPPKASERARWQEAFITNV